MKKKLLLILSVLVPALLLWGCGAQQPQAPASDPRLLFTEESTVGLSSLSCYTSGTPTGYSTGGSALSLEGMGSSVTVLDEAGCLVPSALVYAACYDSEDRMTDLTTGTLQQGTDGLWTVTFPRTVGDGWTVFFLDAAGTAPLCQQLVLTGDVPAAAAAGLDYSFYPSTRKVLKTEPLRDTEEYTVRLARNEAEACQIVVCPEASGAYTVTLTPFRNLAGETLDAEVFWEYYVPCAHTERDFGEYPDALVPITEAGVTLTAGENQPFYLRVSAGKDVSAGDYAAAFTLRDPGGNVVLSVPVAAEVWDFTLSDTPSCETAFGLNRWYISEYHGVEYGTAEEQALYEAYYEYMLQHNISPYDLPYDVLDDRADAYMSDPRVTSFVIPYPEEGEEGDAYIKACYEKLNSNPEWAAKGFYYLVDEPHTLKQYDYYEKAVARLEVLFPNYNVVTPFAVADFEEEGEMWYAVLLLEDGHDTFCPVSNLLDGGWLLADKELYMPNSDLWWYVCCGPTDPYNNVFTHWEGLRARLLLWQQKAIGAEGLLYWETAYWKEANPWDTAWLTRFDWIDNNFGDGSLLYPGNRVGIDGPVGSLRLEELSDGIEDFEYLTMAEEVFGRDYVEEMIGQLSASLTEYTRDDELLTLVRQQIGEALSGIMA